MKRLPLALIVFVVGILVSVSQIFMLGPLLPARVASHFGADGRADGFMPRGLFLAFQWAITGFMAGVFLLLPRFIRATPAERINLPHKDFWLDPERRAATFDYLADRMYAFGSATIALLVCMFQMTYSANIRGTMTLGSAPWIALALYLAYTAIWLTAFVQRFRLPR